MASQERMDRTRAQRWHGHPGRGPLPAWTRAREPCPATGGSAKVGYQWLDPPRETERGTFNLPDRDRPGTGKRPWLHEDQPGVEKIRKTRALARFYQASAPQDHRHGPEPDHHRLGAEAGQDRPALDRHGFGRHGRQQSGHYARPGPGPGPALGP